MTAHVQRHFERVVERRRRSDSFSRLEQEPTVYMTRFTWDCVSAPRWRHRPWSAAVASRIRPPPVCSLDIKSSGLSTSFVNNNAQCAGHLFLLMRPRKSSNASLLCPDICPMLPKGSPTIRYMPMRPLIPNNVIEKSNAWSGSLSISSHRGCPIRLLCGSK